VKPFRSDLTALIPSGWLVRESIELASVDDNAYVTAAVDAVDPKTTAHQLAERYATVLSKQLSGYEEIRIDEADLPGGRSAVVRKFRWTPPSGEPVEELQMYAVQDGRGVVATAMARETGFDELEPKLRELLAGIGIGTPASAGGVLRSDGSARNRTYEVFEAGLLTTSPAREEADPGEPAPAWTEARASWQRARETP
jgi:hypothetical protein